MENRKTCCPSSAWNEFLAGDIFMDADEIQKAIKRKQTEDSSRQKFEQSLPHQIDRYLEIDHQAMIGGHYFAEASSQCIDLYTEGNFIATVMMSHAINEAIIRFVAERNNLMRHRSFKGQNLFERMFNFFKKRTKSIEDLVRELRILNKISKECEEASIKIIKSFRADIHHLNPKVETIDFTSIAKQNIQRLAVIEREIFEYSTGRDGKIVPKNPIYWDIDRDGTTTAYLRFNP